MSLPKSMKKRDAARLKFAQAVSPYTGKTPVDIRDLKAAQKVVLAQKAKTAAAAGSAKAPGGMIPNTKKYKLIRLTKSRQLWTSEPEETMNPFGRSKAERRMYYQSAEFELPLDVQHVETIFIDGKAVWERSQGSTYASAILGGGGRFNFRRRWYNRKIVAQSVEFKDVPMRGNKPSVITITARI